MPNSLNCGEYFNPRSPHGERPGRRRQKVVGRADFNPRSPHGERQRPRAADAHGSHFNPRSPHGERRDPGFYESWDEIFQSTLPARGATWRAPASMVLPSRFQSTLPARGATGTASSSPGSNTYFNPRSPHGERPAILPQQAVLGSYFNPRSPHGERLFKSYYQAWSFDISIHAPRTGSDAQVCRGTISTGGFQSTLPARGATICAVIVDSSQINFNPRSPHGERRTYSCFSLPRCCISIHAPRTGSDTAARRANA